MYSLVKLIPDGLGELRNLLERHICSQGNNAIEKCGDEALNVWTSWEIYLKNSYILCIYTHTHVIVLFYLSQDPKVYVETILSVHRKYNALVMDAFGNDTGFIEALDKVILCWK